MSFTAADVERAVESSINGEEGFLTDKGYGETVYPNIEGYSSLGYGSGYITLNDQTYFWKSEENIGGEGQGDYAAVIFSIETDEGKRYFRQSGYYSSYEGTDWDDGAFEEVEPYEKKSIDYRSI